MRTSASAGRGCTGPSAVSPKTIWKQPWARSPRARSASPRTRWKGSYRRAERRWTLELQAGAMVTFTEHAGLCRETVRRHLPENDLKPSTAQPMRARRCTSRRPSRSGHTSWLNTATRRSPSPPHGDLADDPLWLGDPLVEALEMTSFPIMCQRAPSRFPIDRSGPRHGQISIGLSAPTAWFQPT
jgi:hypothetical protein